jgi:hypothetical protein
MVRTITWKTKGKAKEKPKDTQPTRTQERRKLVPLVIGTYIDSSHQCFYYSEILSKRKIIN